MAPPDHDCPLTDIVLEQHKRIEQLLQRAEKQDREIAQLKKALFGPKSERSKMPSVQDALGKEPPTQEARTARRRERARQKGELPTVVLEHRVPDAQRCCPKCGNQTLTPLGDGRTTSVFEYVPAKLVRMQHVQEVLRCRCGDHVVTAPGAPKVIEQGRYGASLLAHLVVAKCADSIPIYRIEKDFKRQGVPIARSTLNGCFIALRPSLRRCRSACSSACGTDRSCSQTRRARACSMVARASPRPAFSGRLLRRTSAATPTSPSSLPRIAAGKRRGKCSAARAARCSSMRTAATTPSPTCPHETAPAATRTCVGTFMRLCRPGPSAQQAIDLILDLDRVEHTAKEQRIVGTAAHLALRKERAGPVRERLKAWLDAENDKEPPKSPLGVAIRYARSNWTELGRFLDDARIPLDNNASERARRRVALGRKNFLFVGDIEAGKNIAGLYSLVATCETRGINPLEYLTDVLSRLGDHPHARIDELLPSAWAAAR